MLRVIEPPQTEAVTLEEFKDYMHIKHDHLDLSLGLTLKSAQQQIEAMLGVKFITQTIGLSLPLNPTRRKRFFYRSSQDAELFSLGIGPLQNLLKVQFKPDRGAFKEIPVDEIKVLSDGYQACLAIPHKYLTYPAGLFLVEAVVGFAESPEKVPGPLKLATMTMAQSYHRGGTKLEMSALKLLLAPYMKRAL